MKSLSPLFPVGGWGQLLQMTVVHKEIDQEIISTTIFRAGKFLKQSLVLHYQMYQTYGEFDNYLKILKLRTPENLL